MEAYKKILNILHLDDDLLDLENVKHELSRSDLGVNFSVRSAATAAEFEILLTDKPKPDICLIDVYLDSGIDGLSLIEKIGASAKDCVVVTRSMDLKLVRKAMLSGADDFIYKQCRQGELGMRLLTAYNLAFPLARNQQNSFRVPSAYSGSTMRQLYSRIPAIIESAIGAVHICGESGTGKEVVAQAFAELAPKGAPFLSVNCAAIAPTLIQSELFGHMRGAFTGAIQQKRGLIEAASGGWLFLDEVAALPLEAQAALLRVLESQEIIPVGGTLARKISIRVISATNESLPQLVTEGKFRLDLWQRLREAKIVLPPLRERPEEIKDLVRYFSQGLPHGPYQVSDDAMELLASLSWKAGNIRELRNCIKAMTERHVNKLLTPLAVPAWVLEEYHNELDVYGKNREGNLELSFDSSNPAPLEQLSEQLLIAVIKKLAHAKGRLSLRSLAKTIGVSRSTLSRKVHEAIEKGLVSKEELGAIFDLRSA